MNAETFRGKLMPVYISAHTDRKKIHLFYFKGHFVWIKDWQTFSGKDGCRYHHCERCLTYKKTKEALDEHMKDCNRHEAIHTKMPAEGACTSFKNLKKTLRHPIAIYGDFEASNVNCKTSSSRLIGGVCLRPDGRLLQAQHRVRHPLSFETTFMYSGPDCHRQFLSKLKEWERKIRAELFDDDKTMQPLTEPEVARPAISTDLLWLGGSTKVTAALCRNYAW